MLFFLLSGVGFLLLFVAAMFGRMWCGYACPQTVFLDGVFRRVERWIEGRHTVRMRREKEPLAWETLWRRLVKHAVFIALSWFLAHVFLSYFVSMPSLARMLTQSPASHSVAFAWAIAMTGLIYFNFSWFREQLCLIVCPYGRLQSVLSDDDTIVIGYDQKRGEPRGKASDSTAGDCVNCRRCVVVCPTGIDIRNGLQLDCIGCSACVDACDEIMDKLDRPRGLVRYDSLRGLSGKKRRFIRPRFWLYVVLGVVGLIVASVGLTKGHRPFEANLLRQPGAAYTVNEGFVRNVFDLHLVNKSTEETLFSLTPKVSSAVRVELPYQQSKLAPRASAHIVVIAVMPVAEMDPSLLVDIEVTRLAEPAQTQRVTAPFVGPLRR